MPERKQKPEKKRALPEFESEQEERRFWERTDSSSYVDWSRARLLRFPELRPTTTTISLRLPEAMLLELKQLANKQDVPYQSLLKVYLAERLAAERRRRESAKRLAELGGTQPGLRPGRRRRSR
jgi:predicted DNA binding CopG/RHH family protein